MAHGLGADLRDLREARGLTLAQAAARADLPASSLSRWESGQRAPRAKALKSYLEALEAPARLAAHLVQEASPNAIQVPSSGLGAPIGLGAALRAMRARRAMTQADLARAAGVTQGAVAKWESGDSVPSAATVHALGFALGATPEETLALSRFGEGEFPLEWRNPDHALHHAHLALNSAGDLHEVVALGLEAEAWRRAVRDPRWDVMLLDLLSRRAAREYYEGRLGHGGPTAARVLRLAGKGRLPPDALHALDAAWGLVERRGGDPAPLLAHARRFAAALPGVAHRGWAMWIEAKALAAQGRRQEALEITERGIAVVPTAGYTEEGHAWMGISARVEVRLALGDGRGALAAVDRAPPGEVDEYPILIRAHQANDLAVPDEWMHRARLYYRHWGEHVFLGRQRLKALEDRQRQLRREA